MSITNEPIIIRLDDGTGEGAAWYDLTNARLYERPSAGAYLYISDPATEGTPMTIVPVLAGPIIARLNWLADVEADRYGRYADNVAMKQSAAVLLAGHPLDVPKE